MKGRRFIEAEVDEFDVDAVEGGGQPPVLPLLPRAVRERHRSEYILVVNIVLYRCI